jgi:hypothetical protein
MGAAEKEGKRNVMVIFFKKSRIISKEHIDVDIDQAHEHAK